MRNTIEPTSSHHLSVEQMVSYYAQRLPTDAVSTRAAAEGLARLGESGDIRKHLSTVERQLRDPLYGELFKQGIRWMLDNTLTQQPAMTIVACHVLALATEYSSLLSQKSGRELGPAFLRELRETQDAFVAGKIRLLPPEYWMAPDAARQQVEYIDTLYRALGDYGSQVQVLLAQMNYSFFKADSTMSSGMATLIKSEQILQQLEELSDQISLQRGMPHLDRSNAVMALLHAALVTAGTQDLHISTIVVPGAGFGATTAITLDKVMDVCRGEPSRVFPNFVSIEPCRDFYAGLVDFSELVRRMISGDVELTGPGSLINIEADILAALRERSWHADTMTGGQAAGSQQVTTFLFNYVLHRLGYPQKVELFREINLQYENPILFIGDLAYNGSNINRGYFNFCLNGPLNPGNQRLTDALQETGYHVISLEALLEQSELPLEDLRKLAGTSGTADEIFMIAFKAGSHRAQRLLKLQESDR